jgi:biopolymer transport protein ExbB
MIELFVKGGPIMWPILGASILALTVALDRIFFVILEASRRNRRLVRDLIAEVEHGDIESAIKLGRNSGDFVARTLVYGLERRTRFADAMLAAASYELRRYSRGLAVLDTIITLAPLLGLLGTVTGMIRSFGMLGGAELGAPAAITGGIAEALIATAFGLGVAITALLPFNYVNALEEKARLALQDAASEVELLLKEEVR